MNRKRAKLILNIGAASALMTWYVFGTCWYYGLIPYWMMPHLFTFSICWLFMWTWLWITVPSKWEVE